MDLFASASQKEMNVLEEKGSIITSTRTDFTRNRLVILAPSRLNIEELADLDKISHHHSWKEWDSGHVYVSNRDIGKGELVDVHLFG